MMKTILILKKDHILNDYFLNPRDPVDGGNHNHKAFSVLVYGDTVWVGTANGLNRGLMSEIPYGDKMR